jgi:hypothetical protein
MMRPQVTLLLLLAISVSPAAQHGGYISGMVGDRSGTAIAGAEVRVQNEQTGATQKIAVDSAGLYTSSELAAGTYKVTVRHSGFRTSMRADVAVAASCLPCQRPERNAGTQCPYGRGVVPD